MNNVASFESLEFLLSKSKDKYYCITFLNSPCFELSKANYSNAIIQIDLPSHKIWSNERKVISNTNLTERLHNSSIDSLVLDTLSSNSIETWARKENIKLIVTPWSMQKKMENKIFFDNFLKKNNLPSPKSWILESDVDIKKVDVFPVVLQVPDSNGSKGTFLAKSRANISNLIKSKGLKFPLLCREFIDNGIPLGISVLISRQKMIFSAMRVQAYFTKSDDKSIYYGVQWIKTSHFKKELIDKMNNIFEQTGSILSSLGFHGIFNFDFIVRGDEIYFIECNPRLGGSTPHISHRPGLLHGLNFTEEYIKACGGKALSTHKPFIPHSKYEGFNLDLDYIADANPGSKIKTLEVGFYKNSTTNLEYISSKKSEFDESSTVFLYHALAPEVILSNNIFTGFLLMHSPLLEVSEKEYNFSVKGLRFLKKIEKIIINNE